MKQTTDTTDATPMNQNEHGHELALETTYDDNLEIRETFNDGSSTTFIFDPDYEYEEVRVGSDDTVMLKRVFNDGSSGTMLVPTEWFESIRGALAHYF